ncbi:MAG: hypothetical protein SCALA702_29500 [Melioribacteraceae bacterium]|nr:MAG: hypothetical protein SCALA702_29500 [Melioribacteraceae bacterium]
MFENLTKKISLYLFKKNFLKNRTSEIINFNKFFSSSKSFVLIAPENHEELNDLKLVSEFLIDSGKSVTIILNESLKNYLSGSIKSDIIAYNILDKTRFSLPSKEITSKLADKRWDVAIDLNTENGIFSGALINCLNCDYRIGFSKENSDLYYNFQVNRGGVQLTDLPRKLLDSLAMF